MSDIRLRAASLTILSLGVFFLEWGFAAGFLWWLFLSGLSGKQRLSALSASAAISLLPTAVLLLSGAPAALLYGAKTFVLLLLAFWFGQSGRAGEYQSLFVRLFGKRIGFDIGMACEMLILHTAFIADDVKGFLLSLRQKGKRLSLSVLPSFAFGILALALRRAELSAKLLARRGYVSGGTFTPEFSVEMRDILQTAGAVFLLLGAFALSLFW